jgi:hypothetical protein
VKGALSPTALQMIRYIRKLVSRSSAAVSSVRVGEDELSLVVDTHARFGDEEATRLASAMSLVASTWPRYATRVAQDATGVRVVRGGHAGYRPLTREILVGDDLILQNDVAVIASYLVHEATHARLSRHVLRLDADSQWREERRCYSAQAEFLRSLASAGWRHADLWASATEQRFAQRFGRSLVSRRH